MNLQVDIRENATGRTVTDTWPDWMFNKFWWEEGNACCDCNRELFFVRAMGLDDPEETECGDGRYSVRLSDADTGEVLYDEITEVNP